MSRHLSLSALLVLAASICRAGEQAQPELLPQPREVPAQEVLPQPRAVVLPELPYYVIDPPPQFGRRSVWQLMSPNYKGQMRPTVVITPHGGYYLYNSAPYPGITTRPTLYRGYLLD